MVFVLFSKIIFRTGRCTNYTTIGIMTEAEFIKHFYRTENNRRYKAVWKYIILTTAVIVVNPLSTSWFWK